MLLNGPDNPPKLPIPLGGSAPLSNTLFRGPTRVFFQNGMIGSAVSAQRTVECPITFQWAATFPPKLSFPFWERVPFNTWY